MQLPVLVVSDKLHASIPPEGHILYCSLIYSWDDSGLTLGDGSHGGRGHLWLLRLSSLPWCFNV